jgi:multidrug efflux pump subunit AcrA (membrane-fusion protein)
MFSKSDLDSLHSLQGDEFLPPIARWMHLGGLFLVGAFGMALALAAVLEYHVKVRAIATVRPAQEVQLVQGETEGRVKHIEVSENQVVKQGEVLAYLDSPRLPQLQAEQRATESTLENSQTQLARFEFQLEVFDVQILQEAGLNASAIVAIQQEPPGDRDYHIESALAQIAKLKPKRGEQLAKARDRLLEHFETVNVKLSRLYAQQQQIAREIEAVVVRAPVTGKILQLNLRNPGQILRPGDAIARLVPSDVPLTIAALVAARDIGQVERGQRAQLRVSAYPYPDYGLLEGKVAAIAPDALPCQGNCPAGVSAYYEVAIAPTQPYLVRRDRRYPLQPGMEVIADIISRKERVATFILRKARLLSDF